MEKFIFNQNNERIFSGLVQYLQYLVIKTPGSFDWTPVTI